MRQVFIDTDGKVQLDPRSYNPASEGCADCFNLQSYHRQRGRRCKKHGGNSIGDHALLMELTYGGPLPRE
jgi:hypothetical protein